MDKSLSTVGVDGLRPGMTIREISRFESKYACIDKITLKFLQNRFAGARMVVAAEGKSREVAPEELKVLDDVTGVVDIPETSEFIRYFSGSPDTLRELGLFVLRVSDKGEQADAPPQAPAVNRQQHQANPKTLGSIKQFFETVAVAGEQRDQAAASVEDMLERGRLGKFSTSVAEEAVDNIISTGTSTAITAISGLKSSDQTYAHCVDTSVILMETYTDMLRATRKEVTPDVTRMALIAGFMHDIGKSKVPKEILDSTERFAPDSKEMKIMQNHAPEGAQILTDLGQTKKIINIAHYHHVKIDSTLPNSYPRVSYDKVLPGTRLAAVVDVYQALIGKRSYKRNWVPGRAVELLMKLRGKEFDRTMLGYFLRSIGIYPVGSLVRLNTGDLAFVVTIDQDLLERPVVVVVENAAGDRLTHNHVIDLSHAADVSISEVLDHFEHYNASEDEAFEIFRSISL
ncbi:MAG: HD domain-containing protein, partial [SAR324 cluster bacterium]|nr:HD domain-containing protein [SAR324 cluster bacterium]